MEVPDKFDDSRDRVSLVSAVKTPLGFFTLTVLVVETVFAVLLGVVELDPTTQGSLVWAMVGILAALIVLVAFLAYKRPEALRGERAPQSPDLLSPPRDDPPLLGTGATSRSESESLGAEFGISEVHAGRGAKIFNEYDKHLANLSENLDVMGFGLSSFREDHADHLDMWSKTVRIRILLLDPDAPFLGDSYADLRDDEEGNPQGQIRRDVRAFVGSVRALVSRRLFAVRLYRCLPSINVFRVDETAFWGPYLIDKQSRNTPTFEVRAGGILYAEVTGHFDRIWVTYPLLRYHLLC